MDRSQRECCALPLDTVLPQRPHANPHHRHAPGSGGLRATLALHPELSHAIHLALPPAIVEELLSAPAPQAPLVPEGMPTAAAAISAGGSGGGSEGGSGGGSGAGAGTRQRVRRRGRGDEGRKLLLTSLAEGNNDGGDSDGDGEGDGDGDDAPRRPPPPTVPSLVEPSPAPAAAAAPASPTRSLGALVLPAATVTLQHVRALLCGVWGVRCGVCGVRCAVCGVGTDSSIKMGRTRRPLLRVPCV